MMDFCRGLAGIGLLLLAGVAGSSQGARADSRGQSGPADGLLVAQIDPMEEADLGSIELESAAGVPDPVQAVTGRSDAIPNFATLIETRPDAYVIQLGDTLWDISRRFWGDPFFWPKLWSYNPYIGNAHLIYPGNILRMDSGNYVRPPSLSIEVPGEENVAQAAESQEDVEEDVVPTSAVSGEAAVCSIQVPFLEHSGEIVVRADGFLREQGFSPVGKISKAPDPKIMFSDRDIVYLQFSQIADVECGQVYTVYGPSRKKVAHPIYRRRVVGSLYRVLGEVQVVDVNDFLATGKVIASYGEMHRGDLLTERIPIYRTVEIRSSPRELEGYIVEALNQESVTLSTNNIVYIDRGEQDGVVAGDSFYIVRQGDGLDGLVTKGKKDITLPFQVVGKLVVSLPGEYISEAVITEASQVIEIGDHVATQVN